MPNYGFNYVRKNSVPTPYGTVGGDATEQIFCQRNAGGQYSIKAGTTVLLNISWVRALTRGIFLSSKKDPADTTTGSLPNLTLKSNSNSSPADTVTAIAGIGQQWMSGVDPAANMLFPSADVTQVYVTNAGLIDMLLTIAVGGDPS